jgi:cytochrome c556
VKNLKFVLAGLALLAAVVVVTAADDKAKTIKEVMQKLHKKDVGLLFEIGKDLKGDSPDWKEIQEHTKDLAGMSLDLSKNKPPKGEAKSWEDLTKKYVDDAKKLDEAAGKKDKAAASKLVATLSNSCMDCHKAHRVIKK